MLLDLFKKKNYIYSNKSLLDLLPIGSIVKVKESNEKYMIVTYRGFKKEKDCIKEVDYWCCQYPFGTNYLKEKTHIPIRHEDIVEVIFKGHDSEQRKEFLSELEKKNRREI